MKYILLVILIACAHESKVKFKSIHIGEVPKESVKVKPIVLKDCYFNHFLFFKDKDWNHFNSLLASHQVSSIYNVEIKQTFYQTYSRFDRTCLEIKGKVHK